VNNGKIRYKSESNLGTLIYNFFSAHLTSSKKRRKHRNGSCVFVAVDGVLPHKKNLLITLAFKVYIAKL